MARTVLWVSCAAAFVVFCIVQDRVTAEGARKYVALQRDALAGRGSFVTIDEVMRPAVAQSVWVGLLGGGAVLGLGVAASLVIRLRWPDA